MDYKITHQPEQKLFKTEVDGRTAFVEYRLLGDYLDIIHTIVPEPIEGRGMQQENVETTEQETDDEEYEEEQTAQSEEEKEVSCVYRADGTKSLGAILNECGMTMAEFFEKNNPEQIIIAADVLFEVPKKV